MEIRYELVKKRPYTEKSLLEDLSFIKFTNDIRYRKVQLRIQQNLLELFFSNVLHSLVISIQTYYGIIGMF